MEDGFPLTRASALDRWRAFLPQTPGYGGRRNAVVPGHAGVSRLSPAIRLGLLHPEEIVRETLARHELARVEKWVQEVCWRSYWKGWLERRPDVWRSWRRRVRTLESGPDAAVLERAQAVAEGRSGVAVMDAFARELRETGYLHNHARMWWAAFWVHVERLPWELGAAFFFRHLLDADPASNTLSWRWVTGLQTRGKSYLVRRSNLDRWCAPSLLADTAGLERLDDAKAAAAVVADAADLTPVAVPDFAAVPAVAGRIGLWLHADDAAPETGPLAGVPVVAAAAFTSSAVFAAWQLSPQRRESIHAALADGLRRAAAHWACGTALTDAADTAAALRDWARGHRLDAVVAMAPWTGPVGDVVPAVHAALTEAGIALHLVRRPWDAQAIAAATAGFFPFWERTARRLASQFPPAQPDLPCMA